MISSVDVTSYGVSHANDWVSLGYGTSREKLTLSQFVHKCNLDVYSSSKCINYCIFKTEFAVEKYITEC